MHRQVCLASITLASLVAYAAAVEYPYTAYVSSDDVYIRSGPGKNYYPTAKLKRGAAVEVYRHDPGGWYAIRPPRESFSWASARQLDAAENGLAIVNADRAVARVGSVFSDVRDVIQVRMNKGERVELVEKLPVADGKWYKIAPPAGEFRWIYKDYLDRQPPDDELAAADSDDDEEEDEPEPAARSTERRTRPGRSDIRLTSGEPADERPEELPRHSGAGRPGSTTRRPAAHAAATAANDDSAKSFARALADIDLDLSAMITEEIGVWSFAGIRQRAARLIDRAPTAIERGQARVLMNKIDRFAELRERHDTIEKIGDDTQRRNRQLGQAELVRHEESVGPRYDGVGRLASVAQHKAGAPPYVLLDARGQIVSFVTPAPGINLRSYVDKTVGVNGQRGFLPETQKPHLSAQHVTVLSEARR